MKVKGKHVEAKWRYSKHHKTEIHNKNSQSSPQAGIIHSSDAPKYRVGRNNRCQPFFILFYGYGEEERKGKLLEY